MAHSCLSHWGDAAEALTALLDKRTLKERKAAVARFLDLPAKEQARPDRRTYHGWVHRSSRPEDHGALVRLFFALCLALKQPADPPNAHGTSPQKSEESQVLSKDFGKLASDVLEGLKEDGADTPAGSNKPFHSEKGFARYGTGNWLEKPLALHPPDGEKPLPVARDLLRALRAAMDR